MRRTQKGAILPLAAIGIVVAMIAAALAIETGLLAQDRRRNQKVADLAALDAVRALPLDPTGAARASATRNGFPWSNPGYGLVVEALDDAGIVTISTAATKVRVIARSPRSPMLPFVGRESRTISATGVAAMTERAQVEVGSKLASITANTDALVLNRVFGALLGTPSPLTLDVLSYRGLAGGSMSLGDLVTADPALGTPNQLLTTPITVRRLATASVTALNNRAAGGDTAAASAATALGAFASSIDSGLDVTLGDVLDLDQPDGDAAAGAEFNVLNLITTAGQRARIADGNNLVNVPNVEAGLGIPNLVASSTQLQLKLIEAPRLSALGPARCNIVTGVCQTFARTAQMELNLTTRIGIGACPGLLCVVDLRLPLKVSAASATANLTDIRCATTPAATGVDVRVDTSAGTVTAQSMVTAVGLLNEPVGLGPVNLGAGSNSLTFTGPYPTAYQSTASQSLKLQELISTLPVLGTVLTLLNPIVDQLDTVLLGPVMKGLGISIAGADVRIRQVACGSPELVE